MNAEPLRRNLDLPKADRLQGEAFSDLPYIESRDLGDEFGKHRELLALADAEWERSGRGDRRQFNESFARSRGVPVCGRTLDRVSKILTLPHEIVAAVAAKDLTRSMALNIVKLTPEMRAAIAVRIAAGEEPRSVVAEFIADERQSDDPDSPETLYVALLRWTRTGLPRLQKARRRLIGVAGDHESVANQLDRLARFANEMGAAERKARRESIERIKATFHDRDP